MLTTSLIYEAWNNTQKPILYDTSDGQQSVQKEIVLKHPETHEKYDITLSGECVICGKEFVGGFAAKHLLGSTFNDWDVCKAPESRVMCQACAFTLLLNMDHNRCKLNTYSFVASKTLIVCNRQQVRDFLITPPEPPFVFIVTTSQKKHLAIKSEIAFDINFYPVQFEEEKIYCNRQKMREYIEFAESLRGVGFSKTEISSGNFNSAKSSKYSVDALLLISDLIEKFKQERQYELAVYCAQTKEEEEAICYLDLRHKINLRQRQHNSFTLSTAVETSVEVHQELTCGLESSDSPVHQQSVQMELEIF